MEDDLRSVYIRYKYICERGKSYTDDLDPHIALRDIKEHLALNNLAIQSHLPGIIKALMNRKYYSQPYSVQITVNDFFKLFMTYIVNNLRKATPELLVSLTRLLKSSKKYYDGRYTYIPTEVKKKYSAELEGDPETSSVVIVQENECVNIFFSHNIDFFAGIGGFTKLIELTSESIPFGTITKIINFISSLSHSMVQTVWKPQAKALTRILLNKIKNLSDDEIRILQRQELKLFFNAFEGLLQRLYRLTKAGEILENSELEVSIRFLTSKYLEKRIIGITDIISKVTQAKINEKMNFHSNLEGTRWITTQYLLAWIDNHDLIELIFGASSHPEIVKRSCDLIKFLYTNSRFTRNHIDKLWDCAFLKHETDRDAMISLLSELVYVLKLSDLQNMFAKIYVLDLHEVDSQILVLLKAIALQYSRYSAKSDNDTDPEKQVDDNLENSWKEYEETKGKKLIFTSERSSCSEVLEFIWKLCQEESLVLGITFTVATQALEILKDSLIYYHQSDKYKFLIKCIENLKKNTSVISSCRLLEELINSYSDFRSNFDNESKSGVIKSLEKDHHLFSELYSSLLLFKKEAVERAQLLLIGAHDKLEDREENCFTCSSDDDSQASEERGLKHSEIFKTLRISPDCDLHYFDELRFRLNFLKFLYLNSSETLQLKHAQILWESLIINAVTEEEHENAFSWFASALNTWFNEGVVINEELTHHVFTDLILTLDPRFYSLEGYQCFERFFISLNKQHGLIASEFDNDFEVKEMPLLGQQYLWELLLQARNKKVFKAAKKFLKKIYQGTRQPQDEIMQELIRNCMGFISEGSERHKNAMDVDAANQIHRSLSVLINFLQDFENRAKTETIEITIKNHISDTYPKEIIMNVATSMTLSNLRVLVSTRIAPRLAASELLLFLNSKNLGSKSDSLTLGELGIVKGTILSLFEANMDFDNCEEINNENLTQLKSIFDCHSEEVLAIALESVQNNLDEAVNIMFNEEMVLEFQKKAESRKISSRPKTVQKLSEIISNSQEYFALLFQLFDFGNDNISSKVWELLVKIPVNQAIYSSIIELNETACFSILSTTCMHKLLYGLKILNTILSKNSSETEQWKISFVEKDFFQHIYTILMTQNFEATGSDKSSYLCVELLIRIVRMFVNEAVVNRSMFSHCEGADLRVLEVIDVSELMVKMLEVIEQSINKELEGTSVIESALDIMVPLIVHNTELLSDLYARESFHCLMDYLLDSDKASVRQAIKFTIESIVDGIPSPPDNLENPNTFFKNLMLRKLPTAQAQYCDDYFDMLVKLFRHCENEDHSQNVHVLERCIEYIYESKAVEDKRLGNQDKVLSGYLNLASELIKHEPAQDYPGLIQYIYECLFEISATLPRFKHESTRRAGLALLISMTRSNRDLQILLLSMLSANHSGLLLGSIDSEILARSSAGYVGLRNFGATCYMNSLIQQLYMMRPFREGVEKACIAVEDPDDSLEDNLLYQLQDLFWNLEESDKKFHEPHGVCKAFKNFEGLPINVKVQQDVDEFFIILCDRIEELLKPTPMRKLLNTCFGGVFVHEIESCEPEFPYNGESEEQFYRISLDIKHKKTLAEAMDLYIKEDILDGDNKYFCDQHDRKITAKRRCLISKLSNTVVIHLKRFEFNYSTMQRTKMNDYCEFPMKLNLRPWSKVSDFSDIYYEYDLVGVLVHSGYADSGHYYSIIKDRQTQTWLKFDDKYVEVFDAQNLKEECFGGERIDNWVGEIGFSKNRNAYMLIYERSVSIDIDEDLSQENPVEITLVDASQSIKKKIMKENHSFLRDKLLFDRDYSDFLEAFLDNYTPSEVPAIDKSLSLTDKIAESAMVGALLANQRELEKCTSTELYSLPEVLDMHLSLQESRANSAKLLYAEDLCLLKVCTMYALELLLRGKQNEVFVKWARKLNRFLKNYAPGCIWFLQYLTENKQIAADILLECRDSDARNEFKNMICEALSVCSEVESEYLLEEVDCARTKALPYTDENYSRYSLYSKKWTATTTRFLKVYLTYLFVRALNTPKTYAEYFSVIRNTAADPRVLRLLVHFHAISKIYQAFIAEFNTPLQISAVSLDSELLIELASSLLLRCSTSSMVAQNNYPKVNAYARERVVLTDIEEKSLCTSRSVEKLVSLAKYRECRSILLHLVWENERISTEALEKCCCALFDYKFDQSRYMCMLKLGYYLLTLEDSLRAQRVERFLTMPVYRMNYANDTNTFFDVLGRAKITNSMFFVTVLIWWSDLMKYDHILEVSKRHSQKIKTIVMDRMENRHSSTLNFWDYMDNMRPLQQEITKAFVNLSELFVPEELEPEVSDYDNELDSSGTSNSSD